MRIRIGTAVVALGLVVAAGCGGDGASTQPEGTPATREGQQIDRTRDTVDQLNQQTEEREKTSSGDDPYYGGG